MIRRYYAYHAITQVDNPRFYSGVVSTKSWLPKPIEAYRDVLNGVLAASGNERTNVNIDYFARV